MGLWLPEAFDIPLNQREVDFVIPRLDADLPLCIDPFLLYKSRRSDLRGAHDLLLGLFHAAFSAFRENDEGRVASLIDFPEVSEVRFGYARGGIEGRGIGDVLSRLLVETLRQSPALVERGLRHVEELQLFGVGIAEDRISDLAANAIKRFLVEYTQSQCQLWRIPMVEGVPVEHIWDASRGEWVDSYVRLPFDPRTRRAILLVPRWIVRRLPWINYDDFERTDLRAFLRSRLPGDSSRLRLTKGRAVEITRTQVRLVDDYVSRKEREAHLAQPEPPPLLAFSAYPAGDDLLAQVAATPTGHTRAYTYQRLVLQLLNTLLEPELVDGEEQVRTASGVEIRDLIYTNNSALPFLRYLMANHGNLLVTFECKNVDSLGADDINQLANYLGDPLGYCGFIVTRRPPSERILAKARATYVKQQPRRVILILHDDDFRIMVEMKRLGARHPVDHLQRRYRAFVQAIE